MTTSSTPAVSDASAKLLKQYGCGPIPFAGTDDGFYERHLLFDNVVGLAAAGRTGALRGVRPLRARRTFAALGAHGGDLRAREPEAGLLPLDGVSDRPIAGQQRHQPAARFAGHAGRQKEAASTGSSCSNRSPTRAWATAASGGWRPVSSIRWRPCSSRPWATACATSTASFDRRSRMAGSTNSPTIGFAFRIPGKWHVRARQVEVKLNCSFELRGGGSARRPGPSVQPDRHSVRSAGRRLRRPDDQYACGCGPRRLQITSTSQSSAGAISSAHWPRRLRPIRSRACSIRTTPRAWGRDCDSCRSIFWSPARWRIWCGASVEATPIGTRCRSKRRSN